MIRALVFLLLLAQEKPAEPKKPTAAKDVWVALVGGDVETVTKGRLKGATVLIKNGVIHRVGTDVEIPAEAVRYEVKGRLVCPGFVACSARSLGVAGFSSSPKIADAVDPYSETINLALASGITSAYVETGMGGGMFGGRTSGTAAPSAVLKMAYGDLEGMVVVEPAAVQLSSWISGSASERYAVREAFLQVREYLEKAKDFDARKAAGKTGEKDVAPVAPAGREAYVKLMKGEAIARIVAPRMSDIQRALQLVNDFRFKCVLVDVDEGWTMADEIGRSRCWCVITPRHKASPDRNSNQPSGWSIEQAAILKKAGVKFGITALTPQVSTGGIAGRDLMNLNLEAGYAIRGGLDEQTALEALTITAAEMCGVEGRLGSIEAGKDADLLVLDGGVFDYRTFVLMTFVNGKLVYDKDKSSIYNHLKKK
jgi:imidazolonepropionase-like amidohydrolase